MRLIATPLGELAALDAGVLDEDVPDFVQGEDDEGEEDPREAVEVDSIEIDELDALEEADDGGVFLSPDGLIVPPSDLMLCQEPERFPYE